MVADDAVVRDVNVVHHQHAVADARDHPAAFGAAMDGSELADLVVVADFQARGLAVILEILRSGADRGELENPVARADRGVALDNRVGTDPVAAPIRTSGPMTAPGPISTVESSSARRSMMAAGWIRPAMGVVSSTSIADNSASAASSPSTRASACIFHSGR